MALHTDTQIYGSCFDLLGKAGQVIMNMPRDPKKVYGDKIIDACVHLDLHVRAANMAKDKEPHLLALLERLEIIELLLRVCRDYRYMPVGHYADLVQRTQSIGRQANGWRKANGISSEQLSLLPGG